MPVRVVWESMDERLEFDGAVLDDSELDARSFRLSIRANENEGGEEEERDEGLDVEEFGARP